MSGAVVPCDDKRTHYLLHVMRLKAAQEVIMFNGRDGEWLATLEPTGKKSAHVIIISQLRQQKNVPDLWLICTPLKNSRTDWVVEKATELGVSRICPVTTRFTNIDKINDTRLTAIAVEAAEQSERMDVATIEKLSSLEKMLGAWPLDRVLIYGDESGKGVSPSSLITTLSGKKLAILIGPEGGFSKAEFDLLRTLPYAKAITLGPRILRADTAAITAISLLQAATGDWDENPAFRNEENH